MNKAATRVRQYAEAGDPPVTLAEGRPLVIDTAGASCSWSDQVTVSRDRLADALTRLDVRVLTSGPAAGMVNAESMADAILEALSAAAGDAR